MKSPGTRGARTAHGLLLALVVASAACRTIETDPITLDRNILTVDNRTSQDWNHVEIWINRYYRVTAKSVPAKTRFQAALHARNRGWL